MNSKYVYSIIFTFIMPFFVLWQSVKSRSNAFTRWGITLFFTIYGSTIMLNQGADGYRHRQKVYDLYMDMSFERFIIETAQMLALQPTLSGAQDPYKHIVSYIVGAVLQMPGLFFVVIAFVYGYFFSGAMLMVFRNFFNVKKNWIFWSFAAMFFLLKNIEGVNTVRTWTGLWVLFFGAVKYYETKKLKYLILMLCPPLIHFGYFVMIIPALGVLILGNRPILYGTVFVLSSFANIINPQAATEQISKTELGEQKIRGYYVEEEQSTEQKLEAQETKGGVKWYRRFQKAGIQIYAMNILIYSLLFYRVYPRSLNKLEGKIFATGMMTLAFSNVTWFLPAVSNRTSIIGFVFVLAAFVMFMQRTGFHLGLKGSKFPLKLGVTVAAIGFIPFLVYNISTLLDYPSFFLFYAPFVVWFDAGLNLSIKEVLRTILPFLV